MYIAVDATCWHNLRGYGRHARALLGTLVRLDSANEYTFVIDNEADLDSLPRQVQVRLVPSTHPTVLAASSDGHRTAGDMWRLSRTLSAPNFDLLLFPTIYSYVPVFTRAKKVVMIHDVIAEKYSRLTHPRRSTRMFWKAKVAVGRWQADAILTVSDFSKQCLVDYFGLAAESVFVVGEASDPIFRVLDHPHPSSYLDSLGITRHRRTILYVGGFGPHKNVESLVKVFAQLLAEAGFEDVQLVLVGEHDKEVYHSAFGHIKQQIDAWGLSDRVTFTGFLSDQDLVVLLNLGTVLVLPSLMEGFGLPAVEAAACGCPVIATNASPLPQLLGEGGIYFDPLNGVELAAALRQVLQSAEQRARMRHCGITAARALSWEHAARQLLGVMEGVGAP